MALEAVHSNAGEAVAALAELALGVDRDGGTLSVALGMAFDAADETVLRAPYASVYRVVPLVHEKAHVIAAHDLSGFYALVPLGRRRNFGQQHAALFGNGHRGEQRQRQK